MKVEESVNGVLDMTIRDSVFTENDAATEVRHLCDVEHISLLRSSKFRFALQYEFTDSPLFYYSGRRYLPRLCRTKSH